MKPTAMPSTFASTIIENSGSETFQVVGTPEIAVPTTLPNAPISPASTIDTTPTSAAPIAFAAITRPRLGTSVNVVSAVRWLHSPVTDSTAIIGRMTAIGKPNAVANVS
jgi:hypothetical protein